MQWTVLVPAKAMPGAKSRLAAAGDGDTHDALVAALRADTLSAARAAAGVARIVLVSDRTTPLPAGVDEVVVQSHPGLNAALREAAEHANGRWPADGVAALVGDLPALHPDELAAALAAAENSGRSFVADHTSLGTTLLTAGPGSSLDPAFGPGSAAAHGASGAVPIPGAPGLRQDVDTPADLRAALELGVGPATLAVTASAQRRVHLGSA
ncbi:MAG TPA: 2-phospho-L-lactate guanylyltransferase [Jatrophihabitantaceae bacterium]|nr:2-phospho-L-lactate guanylyltransferase [Jatrophihabitantaceae bacterium]